MSYQSIRAIRRRRPPASAAHRDRDLRRLLAVWRSVGGNYITAQAHGCSDEVELADALAAIEDALQVRHPAAWQAMQADLHVALVDVQHTGDAVTPSSECVVCQRIADGLPIAIGQFVPLPEGAR